MAGVVVILAFTTYLPLFFLNVTWFLTKVHLPGGMLIGEALVRLSSVLCVQRKSR